MFQNYRFLSLLDSAALTLFDSMPSQVSDVFTGCHLSSCCVWGHPDISFPSRWNIEYCNPTALYHLTPYKPPVPKLCLLQLLARLWSGKQCMTSSPFSDGLFGLTLHPFLIYFLRYRSFNLMWAEVKLLMSICYGVSCSITIHLLNQLSYHLWNNYQPLG